MQWSPAVCLLLLIAPLSWAVAFEPDQSPQPPAHPPMTPEDGAVVSVNPPPMIWRVDDRAATYTVEFCQSPEFAADVIRTEGIDMPLYNHSAALDEGTWYWRYLVVTPEGETSEPSAVKSFVVAAGTPQMPVPPTDEIIRNMPAHPRIFVTPDTLAEFQGRRYTDATEAWASLKYTADAYLEVPIPDLDLQPMPAEPDPARKQVFYLRDGQPLVPKGFGSSALLSAASRANALSLAYQISGDDRYAEAAKQWALFCAPFRMDYHLEDRGQHDTVVYNYEYGLKGIALAYDRLYDRLSPEEREAILGHIVYHCDNAYAWTHDALKLHLNYQNSHGQQCMHALLTTVLAVADENEQTREWADWLIRQYVNRIPWGEDDGGYTEGQVYGHKFSMILEGLAALRTATGIDVFMMPRLRNADDFWMYCMSLNYWWNHWGDCYSLLNPIPGSSADTYISRFLGSMTGDPYSTWWSDTVLGSPSHMPLWYLSSTGIEPKPPVDIAQARMFPDVGQLAAYDRFYDHRSNRIFFRSSPFGGHSHAHADQNGFVLHAGGEIMAVDAGYYTYAGDTYHGSWSRMTFPHNTLLVNGEGQPKSIEAKGRFTSFLNSADYCLFTGAAATAYPEMLEQYDRTVLFIRPDVFVMVDEIAAPEVSEFSWVLNTFEPAEIDEASQTMVVSQSDQRLRVQHLAPEGLTYTQTNERPYPMLSKLWCRYTEAFPQTYHIRATTAAAAQERIIAVMDAYAEGDGPALEAAEIEATGGQAVRLERGGVAETVLIRSADAEAASVGGIETDGRLASVGLRADGQIARWLLQGGTRLSIGGQQVFAADVACDAAAQYAAPGADALVQVKPSEPATVNLRLPVRPRVVMAAAPDAPESAQPAKVRRDDRRARLVVSEETVLWVNPARDLTAPLEPLTMTVRDAAGEYEVALPTAIADNGEIIAYGHFVDPREEGVYDFAATGAEVLVQDRWDQAVSVKGADAVAAPWREAAEIYVRYAPDAAPAVTATLREGYGGQLVNLLRNGSFEEGSPDYPPRTWTISHPRQMGYTWPYWSQEDATDGASCLKFVRPEIYMTLKSQPMRLREGGTYTLRFMARGDATVAKATVVGQLGSSVEVPIEPSDEWRAYEATVEMQPGYSTVSFAMGAGGEPDQVLWVDDVQFGRVE